MMEKMTLQQWSAVIEVNLTACYLMQQAVGRHMIARFKAGEKNPGAIVNISSTAGKRGSIGQVNYSAAKSGLFGVTMMERGVSQLVSVNLEEAEAMAEAS